MPTPSPTDANKFERLGTYEALFPSHTGTAQWRLLDALLQDVKSSIYGLPEMPVTIKLEPTPNSIVLSLSVGQPPAPTSQVSTLPAAPDVPSQDASVPRYSWDEIAEAIYQTDQETPSNLHPSSHWINTFEWFLPKILMARSPTDPLFPSASNGASEGSSSS